ncbi:sensor histidine kinase [Streptomyces sp. NPDC018019]|uniref:sensor histidine kinase n=1 Tax=Streptomyces sp. NPDC018019 TaxID=3365030 RepID=UPI0037B91088
MTAGGMAPGVVLGVGGEGVVEPVIAAYAEALRAVANPLVLDEELWQGCERQARAIIADCLRSLGDEDAEGGRGSLDSDAEFASMALGARRALQRASSDDSVAAAHILFDVVLKSLRGLADGLPQDERVPRLLRAVETLHASIKIRVRAAFIGYDAFMAHSVDAANSAEQSRLAGDIHDHIGSNLSLVLRCLELHEMEARTGITEGSGRDRIGEAKRALEEVICFARELVSGLRSGGPGPGLRARLEEYVATLGSGASGLEIDVRVNGGESWLPARYQEEIFLVVRECLWNAVTHSGATALSAEVNITPHVVTGLVEDNGRGFDTGPAASGESGGSGLASMRQRIRALDGALSVVSRKGLGTRVHLRVPNPARPAEPGNAHAW